MKRLEPFAVFILGAFVACAVSFAVASIMAFAIMASLSILNHDIPGIPALGFWQCLILTYILSFITTIIYFRKETRDSNS
jgi:Na+-driven multidrug efflux pump